MSKRTVFTTITPLPAGITRETVIETLHNHFEMIEYGSTSRPCLTLGFSLDLLAWSVLVQLLNFADRYLKLESFSN